MSIKPTQQPSSTTKSSREAGVPKGSGTSAREWLDHHIVGPHTTSQSEIKIARGEPAPAARPALGHAPEPMI